MIENNPKNCHALLFGIGKQANDDKTMAVTAEDAKQLAYFLDMLCGYPTNQISLLNPIETSKINILNTLDLLINRTQKKIADTVIIYFSGHGISYNSEYFLVCRNSTFDDLHQTALRGTELVEKLNAIQSKKILVLLDCCHASGIIEPNIEKANIPFKQEEFLGLNQNRAIIAASHYAQVSFTSTPLSVFTFSFIEGLAGKYFKGDDKEVRLFDLAMYTRERVSSLTKKQQQPQLSVIETSSTSNFLITTHTEGKPTEMPFVGAAFRLYDAKGIGINITQKIRPDNEYREKFNWLQVKGNDNLIIQGADSANINIIYKSPGAQLVTTSKERRLPWGISILEKDEERKNNTTPAKFRDYLSNQYLPYISRNAFKKEHHELKDFDTESSIIENLFEGSYEGCIIYGEGGIGKTRLMLELGRTAQRNGWIVLVVRREFTSLKLLKSFFEPRKKYLLVFDYIEERTSSFSIDVYDRLFIENVTLKIIANCRKTYTSSSNFPDSSSFLHVHLDKESPVQKDYENFVIEQILKDKDKKIKDNSAFYRTKPSFAVFFKFLIESGKVKSNDLRQFGDFKDWIKKRMQLTLRLGDYNELPELVINLMATLPAEGAALDELQNDYSDIIDKLMNDGWIEEIEKEETYELSVIHDSIIDELLILHLEKTSNIRVKIEKILKFASNYDLSVNWLRAFERISDQEFLKGKSFLYRLIKKHLKSFLGLEHELSVSAIFEEIDRFDFFYDNYDKLKDYLQSERFALPLSFAQNVFYKEGIDENIARKVKKINQEWLTNNDIFTQSSLVASSTLSTSIKLFGREDYEKLALSFFKVDFVPLAASYVIVSWLESGGSFSVIEEYILDYLQYYSSKKEGGFVIKAWLKYGDSPNKMQYYIKNYLSKNIQEKRTGLVLAEWISAGGRKSIINKHLLLFLDLFPSEKYTFHLIRKYLENGWNKKQIKKYLAKYLVANTKEKSYKYVICSWLDAGGSKEFISASVKKYLEQNAEEKEVSFIFRSWLDAGGSKKFISASVKKYLEQNVKEKEARFVISSWLDPGGDKEFISASVKEYLERNAKEREARFVISSWLNSRGDKDFVAVFVKKYLERNAEEREARFVISSWLDAGGDKKFIATSVKKYLEQYVEEKEVSFVFQSWLDVGGDKDFVAVFVKKYLEQNAEEKEVSFVFQSWLEAGYGRGH